MTKYKKKIDKKMLYVLLSPPFDVYVESNNCEMKTKKKSIL